jgi:hypothetical protein
LKPRLASVETLPSRGSATIEASRVEKAAVGPRAMAADPTRSLTTVNGMVGVTNGMGSSFVPAFAGEFVVV